MNNITNNGRWVRIFAESFSLVEDGKKVQLPAGEHSFKVTPDLRIGVANYMVSDKMDQAEVAQFCAAHNLKFRMYAPDMPTRQVFDDKGNIVEDSKALFEAAGLKEPDEDRRYITNGGFIFRLSVGGIFSEDTFQDPYSVKDVRKAVNIRLAAANRWLRENAPSLKRVVTLTPYQVAEFHKIGRNSKVKVVAIKVGDEVQVPWQGYSHFGSGGAWGTFKPFGEYTVVSTNDSHDNKFVDSGTRTVKFDKPAAVYTAAGDEVGSGRIFYRTLYIVNPTGELAARAK